MSTISNVTDWLTAVGTVVAAGAATVGLAYAGVQLRAARTSNDSSRKTNESAFLLSLEDQFRNHWNVHVALRPGGKWTEPSSGPHSNEEWAQVEAYMGLFERLHILERNGIVPLSYIKQFYAYRMRNIWVNDVIRQQKLCSEVAAGWQDFIELSDKLGIRRPCAES